VPEVVTIRGDAHDPRQVKIEIVRSCGLTAASDITSTNPLLDSLTKLNGTTIHRLLPGSPAIDAGNIAAPGTGYGRCAVDDQRGLLWPIGQACDIGAYEFGFTAYLPIMSRRESTGEKGHIPKSQT